MIVTKGILSIGLDEQEITLYDSGTILSIPYNVFMNVRNEDEEILELFVIKSPSPQNFKEAL